MENDKKNIVYVIIALIVIGLLGWWLLSSKSSTTDSEAERAAEEAAAGPRLAPALQLTEQEKKGDVSDKKAEIMAYIRSGKELTPEQKGEIGGIMLTKANIYNFTEEERQAIFEALSK